MRPTWADRAGAQHPQNSGCDGQFARLSRLLFDKVHTALKHVLDEIGLEYSGLTRTLNLRCEPPAVRAAWTGTHHHSILHLRWVGRSGRRGTATSRLVSFGLSAPGA
jgi:hypothetical protein